MDTENQTRPFNPIPLILISLGIWLPIIGTLLTYYLSRDADALSGSMAFGSAVVLLAQVEIFAIIFLMIYAFAVKPWRLSRKICTVFSINAVAATVAGIGIVITLANISLQ
ncbi:MULTISPECIES: hypothetical protein [Pseudomonas syringae group genomosp. 2]|uniref:Uncharacterized protein n=1 Tax=Pseudomonas amygdali pv. ulmi TaxID=251720 RepID=A0A0Q0EWF1_PSEA0|nr:hypothetical protein [Pseudomonas amygdali]MCQ3011476.1 hypothetical protein [Pseudomonas savastanoi]EGH03440.1 hypothetical protein PSYAE_16056 [Pseudomonas amygdali pv. aesculi str. 0893_23]KPW18027.1 Uncharacterized protein ALO90_00516 [Pseudomonas amygdali pv. aesculi]KPZ14626.1 Uncharacterized protein ALO41_04406 [Pseudomonas amygdali pv. ulmi]KWS35585.1 hypothetical protein AL065_11890 [Pseudomonas amygdali pv. ulmi]